MNIGLIGYGVVGQAAEKTFRKKYKVIKYDKYKNLDKFSDLKKCDFIFIMVPTPFDCVKNKVDESAILESLNKLERIGYENIVVIKSTVPPGSCLSYSENFSLNIVFNPEFLREGTTPNEDFANQDTVVIGTPKSEAYESVKNMFEKVLIPNTQYYRASTTEAEMIKCAQNTMLASSH